MKFTATLSLLTLASIANAAQKFGLVTIHSGSMLQYQSIITNGDDPSLLIGLNGNGYFTLNDDNTLTDFNGKLIGLTSDGALKEEGADGVTISNQFGITDAHLTINGKQNFIACPKDNGYYLAAGSDCANGVGIALLAQQITQIDSTTATTPSTTKTESPTTTTATTSTATPASTGKKYGLVTIKSGTDFQYQAIKKVDSHPHVFSVGGSEGEDLVFTFNDDGSLVDQSGRGIYVDPTTGEIGNVDPFGAQKASTGFAIKDSDLTFDGVDGFYACPSGENVYSLSKNECTGGTGVALYAASQ